MSEHAENKYIVDYLKLAIFKKPVYQDAAFTARKEKEAAFRGKKPDLEFYKDLEKDIAHHNNYPYCASLDHITGLYTCYFFHNGYLMSGTTNVKPRQGHMSRLWSSRYGNVDEQPFWCEVHSKNAFVLWYT